MENCYNDDPDLTKQFGIVVIPYNGGNWLYTVAERKTWKSYDNCISREYIRHIQRHYSLIMTVMVKHNCQVRCGLHRTIARRLLGSSLISLSIYHDRYTLRNMSRNCAGVTAQISTELFSPYDAFPKMHATLRFR